MTRRTILALIASLACSTSGSAQARPGQRIASELRLVSVTRSSDTSIVAYRIHVDSSSREGLFSFTVAGTGVPFTVVAPPATTTVEWATDVEHRGRAVAQWVLMGSSPKGVATPPLVMKGVGLPGVSVGWIQGEGLPTIDEDDPDAPPDDPGDVDPLKSHGIERAVVGIDPYPPASHVAYAARLESLISAACRNDWITSSALCTDLDRLMSGTPRVLDLLAAVEAGYPAGRMNSLAYWTLKVNGEATRDLRDPQLVDVSHVCGNRFRIRNRNYVPVTVTYRLAGSAGTGTATLAGRASDASEPVETIIALPSAGTVELLLDGAVFRTQANGAVSCR